MLTGGCFHSDHRMRALQPVCLSEALIASWAIKKKKEVLSLFAAASCEIWDFPQYCAIKLKYRSELHTEANLRPQDHPFQNVCFHQSLQVPTD